METKDQFQKIIEWMRQMSRSMVTHEALHKSLQEVQDRLLDQIQFSEKKLHMRIDALDERFDALSEAVQALLKAMRGLRVEQFNDRTRFQKEIQKMKQEIRELMH